MTDFVTRLRNAAASQLERDAPPQLLVATVDWDEARKHLRVSYFFDCRPDEVDFEQLEFVAGETYSDAWVDIETLGTVFVFDKLAVDEARSSSARVFAR